MIDYFGSVLTELRNDADVVSITDRIRGHKPGPDDARGDGEYLPFVVLTDLGGPPMRRVPIQRGLVGLRCYGVTPQGAKALYVACSNALHDVGPRIHGSVLIYDSADGTGGDEGADPQTKQPYVEGVIEFVAAALAVA
jgi:hypothetical protein